MTQPSNVNDKNAIINFATEEKQDAIIEKMPILEENGGVPVNVQDQVSTVVAFYMREVFNTATLSVPAVSEQNTVTLVTGHNFVIGNTIVIKEGDNFFQADVLGVATNIITLDSPIDFAFQVTATVQRCNKNLNVNGSVTPRVFFVSTAGLSVDVDVTAVTIHMRDTTAMDSSTFGSIAGGITKGVVLRRKDGILKNYFNAKNNGDFGLYGEELSYPSKIGGGEFGVSCRIGFAGQHRYGVVIRLYHTTADQLQMIVQDDLSSLSEFHVIVQGHVVTN